MSQHRVMTATTLATGTILLRLTREGLDFQPGQHVLAGRPGGDVREYSVFSAPADPWLELLVRVIPDGGVSPQLAQCRPGDTVTVDGPMGAFTLPPDAASRRFLFVATGTGIAPFHAMVRAVPGLDFHLVHGVRSAGEQYARAAFPPERYTGCLSREPGGDFQGRVTQYLSAHPPTPDCDCYLCGSCNMIYDTFAVLATAGIARDRIHVETYY